MKNPVPKGKMRIIGEIARKPPMYLAGDGTERVTELTMCTLWNGQEWTGWAALGSFMAHMRTGIVKANKPLKDVGLEYPTEIKYKENRNARQREVKRGNL